MLRDLLRLKPPGTYLAALGSSVTRTVLPPPLPIVAEGVDHYLPELLLLDLGKRSVEEGRPVLLLRASGHRSNERYDIPFKLFEHRLELCLSRPRLVAVEQSVVGVIVVA